MERAFMLRIIFFLLGIGAVNAMQVLGIDYTVIKSAKCEFNVSEHLTTSTAIRCAMECGKRIECSCVNFKRPQCEILNNDSANGDLMAEEQGWKCISEFNECESLPCINGHCTDRRNDYTCDCFPGYDGVNCEDQIDECESSPCLNGQCVDNVDGYICNCGVGYQGTNCDVADQINECESSPCLNGQCMDICNCDAGYQGPNCDEPVFCNVTLLSSDRGDPDYDNTAIGIEYNQSRLKMRDVGHVRGIFIVEFDLFACTVLNASVFDTYNRQSEDTNMFVDHMANIPPETTVFLMTGDEYTHNLNDSAREMLSNMGSPTSLVYRSSLAIGATKKDDGLFCTIASAYNGRNEGPTMIDITVNMSLESGCLP